MYVCARTCGCVVVALCVHMNELVRDAADPVFMHNYSFSNIQSNILNMPALTV